MEVGTHRAKSTRPPRLSRSHIQRKRQEHLGRLCEDCREPLGQSDFFASPGNGFQNATGCIPNLGAARWLDGKFISSDNDQGVASVGAEARMIVWT